MKTFQIDITGHGEEMLKKAFDILEDQWKGQMFTFYSFRERGDKTFFVLHFLADDTLTKELPYPMTIKQGFSLATGWLKNAFSKVGDDIRWRIYDDFRELELVGVGVVIQMMYDENNYH